MSDYVRSYSYGDCAQHDRADSPGDQVRRDDDSEDDANDDDDCAQAGG